MATKTKEEVAEVRFDPMHCFRVWFPGWRAILVDAGSAREAKEIAERHVRARVIKVEDLNAAE